MKSNFYNPKKAEQETKEKEKKVIENLTKKDFFKRIRDDKFFQKYIMEGIIEKEIELNRNIASDVANLVTQTPEVVKSILVAKSGGLKTAENIKNKILNS
jgi:hypothetical protein